jgi:hypothetical protein
VAEGLWVIVRASELTAAASAQPYKQETSLRQTNMAMNTERFIFVLTDE